MPRRMLEIGLILVTGIFLLSLSLPAAAQQSAAGVVVATSGELRAVDASQRSRQLTRGASFYQGDTLSSSAETKAIVRFTDGTVVSLQPASNLKVDQYAYNANDRSQNKQLTTLSKGGMRVLTGLVSKRNPNDYKVRTPVAVIGVRGTMFQVKLLNNVQGARTSGVTFDPEGAVGLKSAPAANTAESATGVEAPTTTGTRTGGTAGAEAPTTTGGITGVKSEQSDFGGFQGAVNNTTSDQPKSFLETSMSFFCEAGTCIVSNQYGSQTLTAGQFAVIKPGQAPQITPTPPPGIFPNCS